MTNSAYEVVCVTTRDYGQEWMVIRTDHFTKGKHVTPHGLFKSQKDAEIFVQQLENTI